MRQANLFMMSAAMLLAACGGTKDAGKTDQVLIEKSDIKIEGKRMTPEALWAMGRIGGLAVSPDGKKIAYTVAYYSVPENKSNREVFVMNADGSDNRQITRTPYQENEVTWIKGGTKLAFLSNDNGSSQLYEMNPDGDVYKRQGLDSTILEKMGLPVGETPGLGPWRKFLERRHAAETKEPINIALVGKYDLQDAYKSIREALSQAGTYNDRKVEVHFVNSEKLTDENVAEALKGMAGVMIGPGFGQRGIDGKFVAIKYTRTHDIPTFGICLGMQCIAIEFARNVLGYADADSREMDEKTPHNVIDIMEEQKAITNMGGTMRLGAYECVLQKGSKAYLAYGEEHIQERHRHRYEFNNDYKAQYEAAGMKCVGINPESDLVEIVEIPALKWFIGTQFHPEYSSTVLNPHPLFVAFVKAAIENEKN